MAFLCIITIFVSEMKADFTYPKHEKLKSKKIIDMLFSEGKSVSKYPLRLVYLPISDESYTFLKKNNPRLENHVFGVSVSKKYFKHAVDRNYFKRVLRECYRLNKTTLVGPLTKPHAFMFFYQSNTKLSFDEINEKTIHLFEKFHLNQ